MVTTPVITIIQQSCFLPFLHIGFLGYLHTKGVATVISRCVLCRKEMQIPTLLSGCFCGNGLINTKKEEDLPDMPHSCGQICGRSRGEFCNHPCTDICHPGQCHPCSATISLPCQCGRTEYVVVMTYHQYDDHSI